MVRALHDLEGPVASSDVDAEFLAIVCADEELLGAEFEAIVSGLAPPPSTPPSFPEGRGQHAVPGATREGRRRVSAPPPTVRPQPTGRERSPPWLRRRRPDRS